jgi:negative regulator of flagellin synthesis FlgM
MSDIAPATPLYGPSGSRIDHSAPASPPSPTPTRAGGRADPAATPRPAPQRPSDRVDISQRAHLLARMATLPEIRQDLVSDIRRQIAEGHYETPERLEAAIDELLSELR